MTTVPTVLPVDGYGSPGQAEVPLRGRGLRFVLVDELAKHDQLTVAEMVHIVRRYGFDLGGRESKIISDALRWELARGRVVKVARGVYRYGKMPASTARRIRIFADAALDWIVALTRTKPPTRRPSWPIDSPIAMGSEGEWPPWHDLRWLWSR